MIKLGIENNSPWPLPEYGKPGDAGMDVRANLEGPIEVLGPLERKVIPTGLRLDIPEGYEVQVRPRSGLAAKHGVTVLNSPGTIDSGYTGEVGVILVNLSPVPVTIKSGDRIAQLVLSKHETIDWEPRMITKQTDRGAGGFGSTGK